jgi:uncharacterized protein (DUF2461 family)
MKTFAAAAIALIGAASAHQQSHNLLDKFNHFVNRAQAQLRDDLHNLDEAINEKTDTYKGLWKELYHRIRED